MHWDIKAFHHISHVTGVKIDKKCCLLELRKYMLIRLFDHQKFVEYLISVKCLILKENKVAAFEIIYSLVPSEWLKRWERDPAEKVGEGSGQAADQCRKV